MADRFDIPQYVRFRFRDRAGLIVTIGSGMGTFMYFSNLEVKGRIIEAKRGIPAVFSTTEGYASYAPTLQPRRFDFTINTYEAATFAKLDLINQFIALGYRIEFWILEGFYEYNSTTNDLTENDASPIFTQAVLEYRDGEASHRQIKRGMGLLWQAETPVSIYEGKHLTIPALPTAPTQDTDIFNT